MASGLSFFSKSALGIDIGVSSIKIVELSPAGRKKKLENYIEFQLPAENDIIKSFHSEEGLLMVDEVVAVLKGILKKAKIKQKRVAFAIPDFSTFFTTFSLPPMSEEEVPKAIEFEARHHIPIPLSEVTFDWQVVEKEEKLPVIRLKVLLVAVPKKVLGNYQRVAQMLGFNLKGMEAEVFGLIRSVLPKDKFTGPVCLVDFGWQSTTISLVRDFTLISSHSFDISSSGLTRDLSEGLGVSFTEAEALKRKYGLDPQKEDVFKVLAININELAAEIEKVCKDFEQSGGQNKVQDIVVAGGTSALFGLKDYLTARLKRNINIAEPFANVTAPNVLQNHLKKIGPSFAVALGVGMMGAE